MRFPFISRALFEEVSRQRDEYKRELHRFQDIVAKQNWGEQIHDTLPVIHKEVAPVPEPMPEAQATEEEMQDEYMRQKAHLATIARTRKSQLPQALERAMSSRLVQRARAAVGPDARRAVAERFEKLKAETLKSIQ